MALFAIIVKPDYRSYITNKLSRPRSFKCDLQGYGHSVSVVRGPFTRSVPDKLNYLLDFAMLLVLTPGISSTFRMCCAQARIVRSST